MNYLTETFTLANGVKIPKVGLGTWQIPNNAVEEPVAAALKHGYRHIDSATDYGNEQGVGKAVRESSISRSKIFVTTKILAELKTYTQAKQAIEKSLATLDIEYIDLMLIHAPRPWAEMSNFHVKEKAEIVKGDVRYLDGNIAVWRAMEEAYKEGKLKSIGVSNFDKIDLQNIIDNCHIVPMVDQISYYISRPQKEIVDFCRANNILVQGYSPIATGRLLGNPDIEKIAQKYGVTLPQICIKYVLQNNVLPLPKSTNPDRIIANSQLDFEISKEDMAFLDQVKE